MISKLIHKYITEEREEIDLQNKIFFTEENMEFFNNRFNAVLNEMLFWFYYQKDTYPIVNKRAQKSKEILEWALNNDFGVDLSFNNTCMSIKGFNSIEDENLKITKQLMLDQLFYSIDEMKSMTKVDEKYEDKNNEIYKFYKKLWNTIKVAKRTYMYKDLNLFRNIIYHGAPGTSKTYDMKKEIKEHLDLYEAGKSEFIQFHGSYYYEDFIGGLKPNTKSKNGLSLEFRNGIFKELCREAAKYELAYYVHKDWDGKYLDEHTTLSNEITLKIDEKEYKLKTKEPVLSQFPPYFILIDEINRADLSKVFGELLFAIEDNYRGFENRFKLSTSQMENEDTAVYWDDEEEEGRNALFFVPKNLYIRGTMNDIDKSIDSIDFAFRRRFKWVEKKFEKGKIKDIIKERGHEHIDSSSLEEYSQKCVSLNRKIVKDISIADETYKIGHAIFADIVKYIGDKSTISKDSKELLFNNHIEPIVYNYLKMDYGNERNDINTFKEVFVD